MLEQFEKCLDRVNFYLKFLGLSLDNRHNANNFFVRVLRHRTYSVQITSFYLLIVAQVISGVEVYTAGQNFLDLTRLIPCLIFCITSNSKSTLMLYYARQNNDFIATMKNLIKDQLENDYEGNSFKKSVVKKHILMLANISNKILMLIKLGVVTFSLVPVFTNVPHYFKTREVKLEMPFIAYYPFNEFDLRLYPWIYLHQVYTASVATLMVYGPDCFFFTCCIFVQIQFALLNYDMERLVNENSRQCDETKFKKLVARHIDIMRCVNILETMYTKSMLISALTSSVLTCITGFNILMIDNIVMMAGFLTLLIFTFMQIFLVCYFGDAIMRFSMDVGDAIYNTQWYNVGVAQRKNFLMILIRARKPCELTANGYYKMNLTAFMSIMSSSWSYFALLNTIYHPE